MSCGVAVTIDVRDIRVGCTEGNRVFLFWAGAAGHTSLPARRVGSVHG